jgi:hypothetical protein
MSEQVLQKTWAAEIAAASGGAGSVNFDRHFSGNYSMAVTATCKG